MSFNRNLRLRGVKGSFDLYLLKGGFYNEKINEEKS